MNARLALSILALLAVLPTGAALAEQPTEPGELWENTQQMDMAGMSMPPRTSQACVPANSSDPPRDPNDKNCEMYDVTHSGNTTSWKMRCTGSQAATGSGQITYQGRQSYQGQMTMTMEGQTMNMKMSGKRLGGACDAGKIKRDVVAAQAQSDKMIAQQCAESVKAMQVQLFDGTYPSSCGAKYKTEFCSRIATEEGYDLLAVRDRNPMTGRTDLESAGTACGADTAKAHDKLCAAAVGKDSSMLFMARHCPDQAAPIAQKECAGRGFTSPPAPKYQEFCSAYARHGLMGSNGAAGAEGGNAAGQSSGQQQGQPDAATTGESAVNKGKKALKKLLPF
jgi:hypothetical protein